MKKRTLEELRKEINGKQVFDVIVKMDAILIWPPKGEQVSVKPYGYTSEEIKKLLDEAGYEHFSIEEISAPEFCIASCKGKEGNYQTLQRLADIPNEGEFDYMEVTSEQKEESSGANYEGEIFPSSPSCPYG